MGHIPLKRALRLGANAGATPDRLNTLGMNVLGKGLERSHLEKNPKSSAEGVRRHADETGVKEV